MGSMIRRLRVPAALTVTVLGCNGGQPLADARLADGALTDSHYVPFGDGNCGVVCFSDGTDAGVCPDPIVCVSEDRMCPAGCMCSTYCFPRTAQGELNCPTHDGLDCAGPDRECPDGCEPVG
jgi:hypothetical protein